MPYILDEYVINKLLNSFLVISFLFSQEAVSQIFEEKAPAQSLYEEIINMDSLLFDVAFNKCDLELYKTIMSPDLEFYDDRSGLNILIEKEIASFEDRCSKPFNVTSKLVTSSVHVLGNYGVVQLGEHNFYVDDKKVENAKFITVWKKNGSNWVVKRAISYDHKPIE